MSIKDSAETKANWLDKPSSSALGSTSSMKDGAQTHDGKQSCRAHFMWPDHSISHIPLSKPARALFSGETEEGLQTQELDKLENRGEEEGLPEQ